eukprot:7421122-Pyramimonas_sp.AAC.1
MMPMFALPKHIRSYGDGDTSDEMWAALVHQLNACYDGRHPTTKHDGTPWDKDSLQAELPGKRICGGRSRIVIWSITGDLEFYSNELR